MIACVPPSRKNRQDRRKQRSPTWKTRGRATYISAESVSAQRLYAVYPAVCTSATSSLLVFEPCISCPTLGNHLSVANPLAIGLPCKRSVSVRLKHWKRLNNKCSSSRSSRALMGHLVQESSRCPRVRRVPKLPSVFRYRTTLRKWRRLANRQRRLSLGALKKLCRLRLLSNSTQCIIVTQ